MHPGEEQPPCPVPGSPPGASRQVPVLAVPLHGVGTAPLELGERKGF